MKKKLESTDCPLCNSGRRTNFLTGKDYLYSLESFVIAKCLHCGALYTNPRVIENEIGAYYQNDYKPFLAKTVKSTALGKLRSAIGSMLGGSQNILLKVLSAHKVETVLDVGAGSGQLLEVFANRGISGVGVELNHQCVQSIRKRGLECYEGDLENSMQELSGHCFDAVVMIHVFEHLYSPIEVLRFAEQLLSPNGILYIEVPDAASLEAQLFKGYWRGYELPRHILHYNKSMIEDLLNKNGFMIIETNNVSLPSSLVESVGFLMFKSNKMPEWMYYCLFYFWKVFQFLLKPLIGTSSIAITASKLKALDER